VEGIARQIFRDQALTVTYALLVSLVVALTLTPMLSALGGGNGRSRLLFLGPRRKPVPFPRASAATGVEGGGRLRGAYGSLLRAALAHRIPVMAATVVLVAGAVWLGRGLGSELIPPLGRGEFRFALRLPEGTPIEETDRLLRGVETETAALEGVSTVFANVGVDAGERGSLRSKKENCAELNVRLAAGLDPAVGADLLARVRRVLAELPGAESTLLEATALTFRTPVAVEIYGYELEDLTDVSQAVTERLAAIPGLRDLSTTVELGSPEVQIRFDRDKLRTAGLDLRSAAEALRTKILGRVATDYKDRDRQIDVLVRSGDAQSVDFDDLRTMVVGYHGQTPVPLASVAAVDVRRGPARITRLAQSRAAVVSAGLVGRDLGSATAEIRAALRELPLPAGVTLEIGGQSDEMGSSLRSLRFAVALAVFLVYLVMASLFESLLDPFLILFTVPMALVGVVAGLALTGRPVSVVVMIGAIMLAGIVVNNGIVLIDLIGRLRRRGRSLVEAVVEAGTVRLRPILMTTITTVLGLTPMALGRGDGAEIGAPLAVTVIGGLLVATLLTLIVLPVLYSLVHREV
jgi:HAE1 family hydrophobic/amphiphilic exporter-1